MKPDTLRCCCCHAVKKAKFFYRSRKNRSGYQSRCKKCNHIEDIRAKEFTEFVPEIEHLPDRIGKRFRIRARYSALRLERSFGIIVAD